MLPSTGYFKAINCPFYESGSCDRPYCHFKHARKANPYSADDTVNILASSTTETTETVAKVNEGAGTPVVTAPNPDVLEKLVTEAVKKVLANQEVADASKISENIVTKVVEELKPTLVSSLEASSSSASELSLPNELGKHTGVTSSISKCVYNPTPIAELKKRHIPIVSYIPTRESKVAAKRKVSPDRSKSWLSLIHASGNNYSSNETYKPTAIGGVADTESMPSYVPTARSDSSPANSYDDSNSSEYFPKKSKEQYFPKVKKRREEYVPRRVKHPLKTVQQLEESIEEDTVLEFAKKFETFDNILNNEEKIVDPVNEESHEYGDVESKFSDNESDDEHIVSLDNDIRELEEEESKIKYLEEKENTDIEQIENNEDITDSPCFKSSSSKYSKKDQSSSNSLKSTEVKKEKSRSDKSGDSKHDVKRKAEERSKSKDSKSRTSKDKYSSSKSKEHSSSSSKSKDRSREKDRSKETEKEKDKRESDKEKSREIDKEKNREGDKEKNRESDKEKSREHDKEKSRENDKEKSRENDKEKSRENDKEKSREHDKEKSRENDKEKSRENDKEKDKSRENDKEKDKSKENDKEKDRNKERDRISSSSSKSSKDKTKDSKDVKSKSKKDSRSEKESSRDTKRDKHKSDKHDRHRSKSSSSNSKKDKHKSHKNDDKHHSNYKSSSSNHKHSSSSKKSSKSKDSGREKDKSDNEDRDAGSELDGMHFNFEDEEPMEISDSDHDVEEECYKIFQEYEVSDQTKETVKKQSHKRHIKEVEDTEDVSVRKRIAHPSAVSSNVERPERKEPKKVVNPHQKLYERWRLMKAAAAGNSSEKVAEYVPEEVKPASNKYDPESSLQSPEPCSSKNDVQLNGNGRIRIAHVPYAMSLALEKKKVLDNASNPVAKTAAQTSKVGARVAHVPQAIPQLIRPEPIQVSTQKFPINIRQHYVNIMHDICVQIYTNGEDAAQRATREEFACHERCKALPVYKNSCMLAAHRLRKEVDQGTDASSISSGSGIVSHEAVLAGKSKGSWSVIKSKKFVTDLHGSNLYYLLSKWILTEQQLKDNGFPRPHPDGPKGRAKIYVANTRNQSIISKVPNERFCSRCNQPYIIDRFGFPILKQNCIYHWGRKFTYRGEGKYSCCQQDGSASGCCDAKSHVWDFVDYENLRGYVTTLPKDTAPEEQGVYALDCEMCYTTQGLELARVTVINEDSHVVYETLVKPENPIVDYNTRFSGITEENMLDVSTSILDVQATLLTMFSSKTILVGHSLESDFKALKLIHETVVDTSVMFPHRNGYPQKRALKNLCSEYLRKIIQNDVGGHDSNEDAVACMELVLWKVKEEAKLM